MSDLEALRADFDRVVRERDDARDRADFLARECARVKDERDELRAENATLNGFLNCRFIAGSSSARVAPSTDTRRRFGIRFRLSIIPGVKRKSGQVWMARTRSLGEPSASVRRFSSSRPEPMARTSRFGTGGSRSSSDPPVPRRSS